MEDEVLITELTQDQKDKVINEWNRDPANPPSLKVLTQLIFGSDYDGRSTEGKLLTSFLASRNLKARSSHYNENKTSKIELSEAHKTYITNNAKTMKGVEMARIIFANPSLTNLHSETIAVNSYVKSLDSKVVFNSAELQDTITEAYKAPDTFDKIYKRVCKYVNLGMEKDKLPPSVKKNLNMTMSYLNTYRFTEQMNNYDSERDRNLCEDSFIRCTYDKPDLTQEEIDQYIELANQVVQGFKIQRRSETLQRNLETLTTNSDGESLKISMSLVEAIGKASTEFHQCISRQEKLLSNLTQKRSDRLDKQIKDTASILNLVEMWKNEESRKELLKIAELEQKAVSEEVDKLASIPEIKARILGLSKDQIKYG